MSIRKTPSEHETHQPVPTVLALRSPANVDALGVLVTQANAGIVKRRWHFGSLVPLVSLDIVNLDRVQSFAREETVLGLVVSLASKHKYLGIPAPRRQS